MAPSYCYSYLICALMGLCVLLGGVVSAPLDSDPCKEDISADCLTNTRIMDGQFFPTIFPPPSVIRYTYQRDDGTADLVADDDGAEMTSSQEIAGNGIDSKQTEALMGGTLADFVAGKEINNMAEGAQDSERMAA